MGAEDILVILCGNNLHENLSYHLFENNMFMGIINTCVSRMYLRTCNIRMFCVQSVMWNYVVDDGSSDTTNIFWPKTDC